MAARDGSDPKLDKLASFAREIGRQAGQILLEWRGRTTTELKSDGSVVTEADYAADRFLCQQIQARYPAHGILSEEAATVYDGERPFTWVIDPLDGSNNFSQGLCYWGCSIGIVSAGAPVVGVLVMPMLNLEFWAQKGNGAFVNGARMGGAPHSSSENNSFFAICSRTWRYLNVSMPQKARLLGSAAYDLAAVAQGVAVGCSQVSSHIWDLAAGWLLLQETGRAVGPLLPGAPNPFPMQDGLDYAGRVFPLAAGADEHMVQRIQTHVAVKSESRARVDAWRAAGWNLV